MPNGVQSKWQRCLWSSSLLVTVLDSLGEAGVKKRGSHGNTSKKTSLVYDSYQGTGSTSRPRQNQGTGSTSRPRQNSLKTQFFICKGTDIKTRGPAASAIHRVYAARSRLLLLPIPSASSSSPPPLRPTAVSSADSLRRSLSPAEADADAGRRALSKTKTVCHCHTAELGARLASAGEAQQSLAGEGHTVRVEVGRADEVVGAHLLQHLPHAPAAHSLQTVYYYYSTT